MASIVKDRKKLYKKIYRIGTRCTGYHPECYNCIRYKYLDHHGKFPDREFWRDWFFQRDLSSYF